ncbi:hypothetical protein V6Z11_D05G381200 [Gossypium hirsutum]
MFSEVHMSYQTRTNADTNPTFICYTPTPSNKAHQFDFQESIHPNHTGSWWYATHNSTAQLPNIYRGLTAKNAVMLLENTSSNKSEPPQCIC